MKEEREAFSKRLANAMSAAGHEPRPSVLANLFNLNYRQGEPVSFQTASRWLGGRAMPKQDKLRVLARKLGMEPHALRYGTTISKVSEPNLDWPVELKPQERELIDAYATLSTIHRKLVRELVTALAKTSTPA